MKKVLAMILVIAAIVSMGIVPTFASHVNESGKSRDFAVVGDYVFVPNTDEVYGVNITWTDIVFTYTVVQGDWDPDTLTRDYKATWDAQEKSATITIENRSNTPVTAEASYTADAVASTAVFEYEGTAGGCVVIGAAEEGDAEGQFGTIEAIVALAANTSINADRTVGVITVTIY